MSGCALIELAARPDKIALDFARAAVVVNDMQNAFCSPGGYADRIGFDVSRASAAVAAVDALCTAARAADVPVVFLQNGFSPDHHEAPGPSSPLWHKSNALRYMRANPETAGRILTKGTWDYEMVEALRPKPGDVLVQKAMDSGFAGTDLDHLLRSRDVTTVLVCGISTNVGVESTLRAAYHLGYFGVLVADACMAVGPAFMQQATEFSIATFYGWVSTVAEVGAALRAHTAAVAAQA